MKFNDVIKTLETIITSIIEPTYMKNNSVNVEAESGNKEYNESVNLEDHKSYNDNKSNGYYNQRQDTSSKPQGVIDSITQEMTPVRLQQAIILSEIVGKPRSKTRKKRRF